VALRLNRGHRAYLHLLVPSIDDYDTLNVLVPGKKYSKKRVLGLYVRLDNRRGLAIYFFNPFFRILLAWDECRYAKQAKSIIPNNFPLLAYSPPYGIASSPVLRRRMQKGEIELCFICFYMRKFSIAISRLVCLTFGRLFGLKSGVLQASAWIDMPHLKSLISCRPPGYRYRMSIAKPCRPEILQEALSHPNFPI